MAEDLVTLVPAPDSKRYPRRIVCPECEHYLPVDARTECDQCGAHLRLKVVVDAPGATR